VPARVMRDDVHDMPRDATDTRVRLLTEAERLFALRGVHAATTREITEAAGQRNTSALTYHFGSRAAVLHEILLRHGTPLDEHRGTLIVEPIERQTTRQLVGALLLPYATCLDTASGRHYLRIVAQLTDRFPIWNVEGELRPPHLRRILGVLESRVPGDADLGRERVLAMILLMTSVMAERARLVESGVSRLDDDRFVAMLADLIVGGLEAPVGPPLHAPPINRA
jgi:AcrR family transcriptional regulator